MSKFTRRDVLKSIGIAGIAGALPTISAAKPRRALRIAHLTDIHVQPELRAGEGMAECLRHVNAHKDKPQMILTGGDLIMDAYDNSRERTKLQWDLFLKTLRDNNAIPVEHCLGNHDIWGWNKPKSGATGNEPDFGKKWALETLKLSKAYRSFDRGGWHFVVLDSVQPVGETGYFGRLDDEQFEWLAGDLAATKLPTLLISHIPILTATSLLDSKSEIRKDKYEVSTSEMLADCRRLVNLFGKHPHVKVALSGHIHLTDRVDYNGVSYLCNGAVSGSWWWGDRYETKPGYAILDLFNDGTFQNQYIPWGWKPAVNPS